MRKHFCKAKRKVVRRKMHIRLRNYTLIKRPAVDVVIRLTDYNINHFKKKYAKTFWKRYEAFL